jgi:hypothetical protein
VGRRPDGDNAVHADFAGHPAGAAIPNYGPFAVLKPRNIWWMVVLIVGISLGGIHRL